MKSFFTNLPLLRLVLFNLLVLSASANAVAGISSTQLAACPDDPVFLTQDVYNNAKDKIQWWYNDQEGFPASAWTKLKVMTGPTCVMEHMSSHAVKFAVSKYGEELTEESLSPENTLVMPVKTGKTPTGKDICNLTTCQTSSTGDFYFGTDFDPSHDYGKFENSDKKIIEGDEKDKANVIDAFDEELLQDNTNGKGQLIDEAGFRSVFGDDVSGLVGTDNSYVYFNGSGVGTNQKVFTLNFSYATGTSYRLLVRMYFMLTGNCNQPIGEIKLDGTYGSDVEGQRVDLYICDDKTNELVLEYYKVSNSQPAIKNIGRTPGPDGSGGPAGEIKLKKNKIYRVDYVISGKFNKSGSNKTINPSFQAPECWKMAIDYISYENQTVCVSPRMACVGQSVEVNAAGFVKNTHFKWYKKVKGKYVELEEGTEVTYPDAKSVSYGYVHQLAKIILTEPGVFDYKVESESDPNAYVEFSLVGEDCEAAACPDIEGNSQVCLPLGSALEYYEILDQSVLDSYGGNVYYTWSLTGPDGSDCDAYIKRDIDGSVQGNKIQVEFPANAKTSQDLAGEPYKLLVTAHNGSYAGSEICRDTKEILLYRNPTTTGLSLSLLKGGAEQAEICAATYADNDTVQVTGYDALPAYEKEYTWTWKDASALAKPYASFSLDKSLLCDGTKKNQKIELVISNEYCRDSINKTFSVTTPSEPVIACPEGLSNSKFSLPDDKNMYEFTVPALKTATAACGELQTTITITDSKGTAYGTTLEVGSKVSLPAGAYTIKYVITDGCNHSNNCEADFTVVDKTPPVMNCDEIPTLSGKLSETGACKYTFDPEIGAPTITGTDNGVAVTITGEYAGRSRSMTGAFSKTTGLNAEYESGVTYIKWIFKDEAGNEAECIQTVTITDDLKPEVTCPTENSLTIGTSTTDCNITWAALKDSIEAKLGTTFPTATKACDYEPAITGPVMYIEGKTAALAGTETFSNGKSYTILYVFTKPADDTKGIIETKDTCKIKVTIKDNTKPVIDCDNWTDRNKSVKLGETNTSCQVNVTLTPPTASLVSDNCTEVDDITFYYGVDHNQYYQGYNQYYPNTSYGFGPGVHIVKWVAEDKDGNRSEPCEQTITVTDNRDFTMNCVADGTILEVPSCPGKTFTWDEIKDKISSAGYDISASYHSCGVWNDNDNNEKDVIINPVMTYSEDGTTFSPIGSSTEFAHGKTYTIRYTFTKKGDYIETLTKDCEVNVRLADDGKPTLNCDKIEDKVLHATADCKVTYDIEKPSADAANDGCTSYSDLTFFFKLDGSGAFVKFNNQSEELSVGSHTIVWKVQDKDGNESENSCTQNIIVRDSSTFKANCATADDVIVDNCSDMTWSQVKAKLSAEAKSTASYTNCENGKTVNVEPQMFYKKTTEAAYMPLTATSVFENTVPATTYDIKWVFRTKGTSTYVADLADSCYSKVTVKDNTAPEVHCDATHMQNPVLEAGDNCKKTIDLKDYLPIDVFEDQCTDKADLIFYYRVDGNGDFIKYTDDATVTFEVSNHNNTIEWKVADEAGNVSDVCTQTFTIKDNNMFNFNCPEYTGTHYVIETCDDLSGEAVLDSLKKHNMFATASYEDCVTGNTVEISPSGIFVKENTDGSYIDINGYTLKYNTLYNIRWDFVKDDPFFVKKEASCYLTVILRDTTAPEFDCSTRPDMAVLTNNGEDYADGSTNGTLRGRLKYPVAGEYKDNCGNVAVKVNIIGPKSKGGADATTVVANQTALDAHKFYLGTSTIQFIFTDDTQNADTCVQIIKVLEKFVPQPNCKEIDDNISLNVDPTTCKVTIPAADFKIPTARIDYWKEVKFKEVASCPGSDITTLAEFDELGSRSADDRHVTAYPYLLKKVENVTATGDYTSSSVITSLEDEENVAKGDTVLAKYVEFDNGGTICRVQNFDETVPTYIKRSEFSKNTEAMRTFGLGTHKLVWLFRNDKGEQDSCSVIVKVTDNSAPVIKCPKSPLELYTGEGSTKCEVEHTLDASLVTVEENCSKPVSYAYSIDGGAKVNYTAALNVPLSVGSHVVKWFVTDAAGNEAECSQTVNVTDNTKPSITCPTDVVVETIATATECKADYSVNSKVLTVSDNCTDESDLTLSYYIDDKTTVKEYSGAETVSLSVGSHKFYWIATDVRGNSDTCFYNITVVDKTKPVFDCSTIDPVLVYDTIAGSGCEVPYKNIKFKDYYATDNCEGQIKGVLSTTTSLADSVKANDKFVAGRTYNLHWVFADKSGNSVACDQNLIIISNEKPDINCDTINSKKIEKVLDGVCEIAAADLNITAPVAKEHCTGEDILGVGHRTSGKAMDAPYTVGKDTIIWVFESIYSTEKDSCWQPVHIKDNFAPDIDCDTIQSKKIEKVLDGKCEIAAADLNIETPVAKEHCTGADIIGVGHRTSGKAMDAPYGVGKDTVIWVFADPELTTEKDSCWQPIHIKDNFAPDIDCDTIKKVEKILEGECEISFEDLKINTPVAKEHCTGADIIGVGYRTSGKALNAPYGVGKDTIIWVFADPELTTEKDSCLQPIDIKSDIEPKFNCDSLKQTPINKVLSGTCVISAADLNVETPFALDACTNDTIWGVGVRRSGKAMDADYEVGRDTIDWTFSSEYSTKVAKCEQYVFIQSDMEPKFDCDSLKNAPIDTVLHGVCVISAADLKVNTPFALDACTNDTIWGVGVRRSGKAMDADYEVGRDTIDWTFSSEYSTKVAKCEQYVFIQSDIEPKFDCDSLKNAPIDTVLHDACVISAADLKVNTPFALDACTNDTIWGVGARRSGKAMDADYEVGRDTIDWKFISEYSTDTALCEQYVYIKSDKPLDFKCDTVTPIKLYPTGCDTILPVASINVPYALDACTKDTIWGKGVRLDKNSADLYTEPYSVGQTHIRWTFISEFSTDTVVCDQLVDVRTLDSLIFACSDITPDTIKVNVEEGKCAVPSTAVTLGSYQAENPCTHDMVDGVAYVGNKKFTEIDSLAIGVTKITWRFVDMSSTLKDSIKECFQYVQVGDINQMPVDCQTFVPINKTLDNGNCTLDFTELGFTPDVVKDLCTDQVIDPVITRYNVILKDSMKYNDPYTVGQDTLYWSYAFRGQEITCPQVVTIFDNYTPDFDCNTLDTIVADAKKGECSVDPSVIALEIPVATDTCNKDLKIPASGVRSDGLSLSDNYPVGRTVVTWTFINMYSDSTVSKVCEQVIDVIGNNKPQIDCDTLKLVEGEAFKGECSVEASRLNIKTPVAVDSCIADLLIPGIGTRDDNKGMDEPYAIGETHITWTFVSPYSHDTAYCEQTVIVRDSIEPMFDCSTLDTLRLASTPGECFAPLDSVLAHFVDHYAVDSCTGRQIKGIATMEDGSELQTKYIVGDTALIKWTFIDSTINRVPKICYQAVIVTGDQKPLIDCDSLASHPISIVAHDACELPLTKDSIPTPFALDACTKDTIWGVGERLDGGELYGVYNVGKTYIKWTFTSPFSSKSAECTQYVDLRSDKDIDYNCDDLDTIVVSVDPGVCEKDVKVEVPVGHNPCLTDVEIAGVATRSDNQPLDAPFSIGLTKITWTFTDTTETLVNNVKVCEQIVQVGDINELPVDCDNMPDTLIVLKDECEVGAGVLVLTAPEVIDLCSKEVIKPDTVRKSGLAMTDAYPVGRDTVVWTYKIRNNTYECSQEVNVMTDKKIEFECDSLKPIVDAASADCNVLPENIKIPVPVAVNPCLPDVKIEGVMSRPEASSMDEPFHIGINTIVWTFTDHTGTLTDSVKVCNQIVEIKDTTHLNVDCSILADRSFYLNADNCSMDYAEMKIDSPLVAVTCPDSVLVPVITRASGLALDEKFEVGVDSLFWTYSYKSMYMDTSVTCRQKIEVIDTIKPAVDCSVLADIYYKVAHVNYATAEEIIAQGLRTPKMYDKCMGDSIIGTGVRSDNGDIFKDNYPSGDPIVITWTFTDDHGNADTCMQTIVVEYVGSNDCPNLPDIKAWSDDKNCFVEASALDIKIPSVHDSGLDKDIDGVGYRSDSAAMDANYPVGTTVIDWMFIGFADDTLTCPQNVIVKDTVAPIINCDDLEDITHFLALDSCVASPATIGIEIPFATDACSSDPIYGIGARSDGREMSEAYEKGTTAITWTFSDVNGNDKTCSQNIIVKDTLAPDFKCETLSNISIIWTQPGDDIPFDFVVNNYGLITDPMVKDSCDGDIYGVPTRSDGAAFNADFKVNTVTKITWIFKDASGNIKECIQDVDITNMPDQDLTCPPLAREVYECAIDTIPQISTTWSSFIAAGGSVSNISYIDTTTFRYEVKDSPDKCHNDIEYWYYVKTLKGKEISCFSSFLVVDNNKPEFVTEVERVIRISCSDTIPAAPEVKAIDLCQGDAEVKLYETTNRSVDRNACEYYSYDIFRRWVAYDGCGNYSDTLLQVIEVRDTLDPYFELPDGWRDTVLATMYKGCRFEIPDLLGKVRAYVRDNCTEMESLDIEQYPAAGTKIEQTTTIDIVLSDFCGNKDTLKMTVLVSPSKAIVHITAPSDVSSCVSDSIALNLSSSKVRSASGSIFVSDGRGGFFSVPSALVWDYYKDYISDSTVIYSSNPTTYYDRFNVNTGNSTADYKRNIAIMDSLLKVNKRIHSGKYIFVAMDTIAYCSDTAEINIDLGEKPRVHFDTGKFDMCEDDELPIDSINNMFNLCVDPMGRSIEKQGWMINGVPYDSSSVSALSDNATLAYYAENSCGVVNSLDSYFTTCTSIETYEDSLEAVGSAANVKKLREDMLKDTSSIFLNVHTRFSPEKMMLTTNPSKPARVWEGEDALLKLETNAEPSYILWYRVQGEFDARFANAYDINANLIDSIAKPDALLDEYLGVTDSAESRFKMFDLYNLQDSALYYAVVADDVCPAMATNVVSIDVTMMIPTAITPYTKDGLNDVFLEKCAVIIFNRYGQRVHEGIGWDGTYGGHLADPGVYFYEAVFPNGKTYKGTVEVVKIK